MASQINWGKEDLPGYTYDPIGNVYKRSDYESGTTASGAGAYLYQSAGDAQRAADTFASSTQHQQGYEVRPRAAPDGTFLGYEVQPKVPAIPATGTGAQDTPKNQNPSVEDTVRDIESLASEGTAPLPSKLTRPAFPSTPSMTLTPATARIAGGAAQTGAGGAIDTSGPAGDAINNVVSAGSESTQDTNTSTPPTDAPKVDRNAVNAALAPVTQIGSMLTQEALQNQESSVAEAQLARSTAQAQSNSLGAARSGNRRDQALLQRQAIGEGAYTQQEGNRQAAELRANEELQNRQFKVDTLAKAGELGLNTAAYEVDLGKADLASASNYLDNQFQQLGLDKQLGEQGLELDQQKTANILQFTRDMAAIQYQYDALSVEDQNEADQLLMQKYNIDQQTLVSLKQIKESGKFRWDQLLANMVGGTISGITGALGKKYI